MAFKHLQAMSFPASFRAVRHCPCRWRSFLLKPSVDPTSVLLGVCSLTEVTLDCCLPAIQLADHCVGHLTGFCVDRGALCLPGLHWVLHHLLDPLCHPPMGSSPAHFYPWRANKPSAPSAICLTSDLVISLQLDSQPGREAVRTGIWRSSWPPNHQGPAPSSPGAGWGASYPGHRRCATAQFSGTWCGYEWYYPPYSIYT